MHPEEQSDVADKVVGDAGPRLGTANEQRSGVVVGKPVAGKGAGEAVGEAA